MFEFEFYPIPYPRLCAVSTPQLEPDPVEEDGEPFFPAAFCRFGGFCQHFLQGKRGARVDTAMRAMKVQRKRLFVYPLFFLVLPIREPVTNVCADSLKKERVAHFRNTGKDDRNTTSGEEG